MKKYKNLIIIGLFLVLSFSSLFLMNSPQLSDGNTGDVKNNERNVLDTPQISYTENVSRTDVQDLDITLHQSIINEGDPLYQITDFNDNNNRTFGVDSPADANFNSTFTNITITDIYAPNKTLIVEDNPNTMISLIPGLYSSFIVPLDCYLKNVSINIIALISGADFYYNLYDAQYSGGYIRPNNDLTSPILGYVYNDSASSVWLKLDGLNTFLDVSTTYNNTYFIKITASDNFNSYWYSDGNGDDTISYSNPSGIPLAGVDLTLKVDLALADNTPKPSDINLQIDGSIVNDNGTSNSGYWISESPNSNIDGTLNFTVGADWWDVKLNITKIQVNYTKSNIKGISNYLINNNDQYVQWNVTLPQITDFDSNFANYCINFTIPNNWNPESIRVWNGTDDKSADCSNKSYINNFREVHNPFATNGSWSLSANSTNLLDSIDIFIKQQPFIIVESASISSTIRINATFLQKILSNDGTINISVYNPDSLNNILNYTSQTSTFFSGKNITVGEWDISQTVTTVPQDLDFRIQIWWHNYTSAGFRETNLTVMQEDLTDITSDGSQHYNVLRGTMINITFNYTVLSTSVPILNAYYVIKSISPGIILFQFFENGNGNYTLRIKTVSVDDELLNQPLDFNITLQSVGKTPQAINITIKVYVKQSIVASGGGSGGGSGDKSKESLDLVIVISAILAISGIGAVLIITMIKKKGPWKSPTIE